jgi:uncharacterized protein involved in cysteine biosynthesis
VPAGLVFLLRRPNLWGMAALPTLLGTLSIASGILLGAYLGSLENQRFASHWGGRLGELDLVVELGILLGTVGVGLGVGLAIAFLLSAPLLEILSRRVEQTETGGVAALGPKGVLVAFVRAGYPLVLVPVAWALSLVPLVGPPAGLLVGAYAVAAEGMSSTLARRGISGLWHRRFLAEALGFGLAGAVLMAVPLVDFLAIPAIIVGGTRLVLELEEAPAAGEAEPAGA